jgi:hypothetical protein
LYIFSFFSKGVTILKFKFFLLSALLALFALSCVSTIQLTGEPRAKIRRSQVAEFQEMPKNAIEIGKVTVSLASSYGGIEVFSQIKKKAAKNGANGYLMTRFDKSAVGYGSMGTGGSFYTGEAIVFYIP